MSAGKGIGANYGNIQDSRGEGLGHNGRQGLLQGHPNAEQGVENSTMEGDEDLYSQEMRQLQQKIHGMQQLQQER